MHTMLTKRCLDSYTLNSIITYIARCHFAKLVRFLRLWNRLMARTVARILNK